MAERKQTRAERRQAADGQAADAEVQSDGEGAQGEGRRQARAERRGRKQGAGDQAQRAERRQARAGRRQRGQASADDAPVNVAELESRLARIEEAVAAQSERSEELLGKLDEVLAEARKSARHAKSAAAQEEDEKSE